MANLGHVGDVAAKQIWDGVAARLVEGERATLIVVELDPGAVVPEHQHPNEQLGVVVEGSLTFTAGDETRELGPGGTWRLLGGTPHRVVAGDAGAVLVETFAPPRADWDGLAELPGRPPRWPAPDGS